MMKLNRAEIIFYVTYIPFVMIAMIIWPFGMICSWIYSKLKGNL